MGFPKTKLNNINFTPQRANREYPYDMLSGAAENLKDEINDKHTFLPKGIMYEDIDLGFKNFIETRIAKNILNSEDNPITVKLLMGFNRLNEYKETWEDSDQFKNVKLPLIIVTREPISQNGSEEQGIGFNIPTGKLFPYHYEVTNDGNKKLIDIYSIPQPIPITLNYEIKFHSYFQEDVNKIQTNIMKEFQSIQAYMNINGFYIPIMLEDISDETNFSDYEEKRFFTQSITFKVNAFILDPEDFVKSTAITRGNIMI
jgi:hypothetical protein